MGQVLTKNVPFLENSHSTSIAENNQVKGPWKWWLGVVSQERKLLEIV